MQNEKQNKHIQQTVGELQQLPGGFAFNSQKVWAGLEQQLPMKKKKSTTWYYAAAAVLLVAGTAYFMVRTGNTGKLTDSKLTAGLSVTGKQKTGVVLIHKTNDHPASESVLPAIKKQAIQPTTIKSFEEKTVVKIETEPAPQVIVPAEQTVVDVPPIEQVNKEEKKKLPAIVSAKPAPKKYKIIHLNELMQSATTPDLQNTLTKSELKKLMQQQNDEKETATPSENNTRQLFFFKIKPATTINTISTVEN